MKRIIALFLCICLVMTVAPVTALARESSVSITFHCDPSAVNDANILVDGMAETTLFDCESFVTEADAISLQFDVYCPYRIAVDDGVSPYTLTREDLVDDKTFDINYDANATNVSVTIYPSDADDYHFHPVECNYIRLIDPTLQTEPTFSDMEFASAVGVDDVLVGFYTKGNGYSDNQFAKVDYEVPTIVADGCVVVYPYGIENLENVFVLHGGAVIDPSGKKFQDSHNSDIGLSDNPTIEELFTANYDDLLPSCYFYDFRTGNDAELPVGRVFDYDTVGSDIPVEVNDYIHAHYFYAPSAYIASPGSGAPDGFLELDDNGELNVTGTITGYPGARIRLGVYTPFIIDDNPVDVYDEQSQSNMLLAGDQDYHVELEYVCYDEGEDLWRWQMAPPNDGPMPQHFFMWYDQGQATVTLSGGDYNDTQVDDHNNYPFEMNTEYTFTVTFNDPEHTTIIGDIVDSAVDYSLVEQPHITTTTFTYTPENDSCVEINLWFDQGLYDFDHFQKEDGHVFVEAFQVGQHGWISDVYVNDHTINGEDKISNQGNLKANISSDEGKLELFFYLDQNVNLEGIRFPDGWGEYIFANNGYPEDVSYDGENIVTFDNFERFLYDNHFRVELLFTGWDEQPDPPGPEEGLEVRYDDTTFDATVYYMDDQDEEICHQDMQYSGDRAPYQNQDSAYALVHFEQKPDLGFERKVYGIIARTNDPSVSYYWIYNPDSPMEYVVADNEITQVELIDWAYAFPNQYIMYFDRGIGGVQVNDIAVDDGEIYDWPANQDYIALTFSVKPYKVEVFADNYTEIIDDAAFTDDTHLNIYRRDEEGIRVATYWSEEEFDFNHFDGGSYQYYYTAYAYGDGLVVSANTEGNEETTAYHGCIKIKTNDQPITFGYQEGDGSVLEGIRDNGEEYLFDLENEVYNLPDNFSLDRNNKTLTITLPD
ncbi:MAG: hypothetical protein J6Z00_04840 [Clostridia bacterium]|nr:hypothetical protein [Clostridia bacterium]